MRMEWDHILKEGLTQCLVYIKGSAHFRCFWYKWPECQLGLTLFGGDGLREDLESTPSFAIGNMYDLGQVIFLL